MNITRENLHRTYQAAMNADSWFDLEKRILDKKDPLLPKKFIKDKFRFLTAVATLHSLATNEYRLQPESDFPFPSSRITVDEVTHHAHGIIHDMRHRKVIKQHFKKLEECVLESDLSILYSTRGVDHPRHDEMKYLTLLDSVCMLFSPMMAIPQIADLLLFFRRQTTTGEIDEYRRVGSILVPQTFDVIDEEEGVTTIQGHERRPLDISETVLPSHLAHSWTAYHLEDRFHRACLLRSLAQVEYATKMAKRMGVTDLHFVMGLGHEQQFTYFLENPENAALLANIYRPSLPIRMARKLKSPSLFLSYMMYEHIEYIAQRTERTIEIMERGFDPPPLVGSEYVLAAMTLVIGTVLYRKHKHRFTNKTYIRSLFSPKGD